MVLNRSLSCGGFAGGTSLINLVVDTHLFDWMRLWCVHSLSYCFPLRLFFSQMWTTLQGKESSIQWTTATSQSWRPWRRRRSELLALLQLRRNQLWLIYEQYLIYLLPLWRMKERLGGFVIRWPSADCVEDEPWLNDWLIASVSVRWWRRTASFSHEFRSFLSTTPSIHTFNIYSLALIKHTLQTRRTRQITFIITRLFVPLVLVIRRGERGSSSVHCPSATNDGVRGNREKLTTNLA